MVGVCLEVVPCRLQRRLIVLQMTENSNKSQVEVSLLFEGIMGNINGTFLYRKNVFVEWLNGIAHPGYRGIEVSWVLFVPIYPYVQVITYDFSGSSYW